MTDLRKKGEGKKMKGKEDGRKVKEERTVKDGRKEDEGKEDGRKERWKEGR